MYEALLIAVTVIAMMCPSVYTIAWSKLEHPEHINTLYIGLAISGFTIAGAMLQSQTMIWLGLLMAFAYFLYVVFRNDNPDNV